MFEPDDLPRFPQCPAFGFSVDPMILVKIIAREGGYESSDRKWAHPLRRFDGMPTGDKPQADIERLLHFWLAVGGMHGEFRFKDYTDFKSSFLDIAIAADDQPLVFVTDSPAGFQMVKQYVFGASIYERTIRRPIGDTVRIANHLGLEQPSSSWTVDESTGMVNPLGGFSGTPTYWGGEFDVLARFAGPFIPEISNKEIQRATVHVVEKRERLAPI